jgi:cupin fold WbuC family metalloprotein
MRVVPHDRLRRLIQEAHARPRKRLNLNIHPELADPVQRLFNAITPGSYVRPHRHAAGRWELFVILQGRAVVLCFDGGGTVTGRAELSPGGPHVAVEIGGATWHTVAALDRETLLLEVKPGPYHPIHDKDFAPWAPAEGEEGADALERRYRTARVGDRLTAG